MKWYNHLSKREVRMLVCEAGEKAYKEAVVRVLNDYYPTKLLGNKYMEYLGYRSLGSLANGFFADRQAIDGTFHVMTPQEALEKYGAGHPGIKDDASYYATQKFISWWRKEVHDDHPAMEHCSYFRIDGDGRIYCPDESGAPIGYFTADLPEEQLISS